MIKAILMDFNGVIINDEPIQMRAYQEILKDEGIVLTSEEYFSSLGMDDRTFVTAAFERAGMTADAAKVEEITAAKSATWREIVDEELPLFEGIQGFVERMGREFTLGIVSMAPKREIEFVMEKSGLAKWFSTIVSSEDVDRCKPDPVAFRLGFCRVDASRTARGHRPLTHAECLVVEDSPPGIVGARRADLPALGVANTVDAAALRAAGAGAVATDLRDWMPESIRLVFA